MGRLSFTYTNKRLLQPFKNNRMSFLKQCHNVVIQTLDYGLVNASSISDCGWQIAPTENDTM